MPVEHNELTDVEVRARAEKLARDRLGVDAHEAFRRMDRGELKGTILESKLSMLRFLMSDESSMAAE